MERSVVTGTAHDASGLRFSIIGLANMPTDWSAVLRALGSELSVDTLNVADGADRAGGPAAGAQEDDGRPASSGADDQTDAVGRPRMTATAPTVLNLNAYLMYATGKAARRKLSEKLTARGLRLWHLTVLAMVADLGPQPKGALASRLDIHVSDLVKVVKDLVKDGYVDCVRSPVDRRRIDVRLTPAGRTALDDLNADIASADDDLLAPLSAVERDQLNSLLRRVQAHLSPFKADVVHEDTGPTTSQPDAAAGTHT